MPRVRTASGLPGRGTLLALQILVLLGVFGLWWVLTWTGLLDPFFFATPGGVLVRTWNDLFVTGVIWPHLGVTLLETVLAFAIGTGAGIVLGFWFARAPLVSAVFDPYVKAANALPRV